MNIKFIYYIKKGTKAQKVALSYNKLINILGLNNTADRRGILYNKAITPQLQELQQTLLNTPELHIIKCNVLIDGQVIF